MPVESQAQVAQEAVKSVSAEANKARKDARQQRAGERTADWLQRQTTPDHGLRALAYGDKEGLRQGPEWDQMFKDATAWMDRSAAKPRPLWRDRLGYDPKRAAQLEVAEGLDPQAAVARAIEERKNQPKRSEVTQAKKEVKAFEQQYAGAIASEEARLIDAAVRTKGGALTAEDFARIRTDAITQVKTAVEFDAAQKEKIRAEMDSSQLVADLLVDKIAEVQATRRDPLQPGEIDQMRKAIVDEQTEKAWRHVHEREARLALEEEELINHQDYGDKFKDALDAMHIDVATATPDQLQQAMTEALAEVKKIMEAEEASANKAYDDEIAAIRTTSQWQGIYNRLVSLEMRRGRSVSPDRLERLKEIADRQLLIDQNKEDMADLQAELAEREQNKTGNDARVKVVELRLQVKKTADALRAEPNDRRRKREAEIAQSNLDAELNKYTAAAEKARKKADADVTDDDLENKAQLLEARAKSLQELSDSLKNSALKTIEDKLTSERDAQKTAREAYDKTAKELGKAELAVRLVSDESIDLRELHKIDYENIPDGIAEKINGALSAETEGKKLEAINELRENAEKRKATDSRFADLFELLVVIAASLGEIPRAAVENAARQSVTP